MISYTSSDRDQAQLVADTLRSCGHSVWMDTSTDDHGGLVLPGIPGGQQHWATIKAAIDEASTFLVLETEAWHKSEYCLREHQYAQDVGKRIAALGEPSDGVELGAIARAPASNPSGLLPQLAEGNDAASTHARLVSELTQNPRTRIGRQQVKDAELLSTAPLPQLGLTMNRELRDRVAALLRAGQKRQRWLRGATAIVISLLLALSAIATLANKQASESSSAAAERADYAASLQLAQQAIQAQTTVEALQLAQRGLSLNSNDATRAALKAVESSSFRSTTVIPSGTSSSAAVSDDGRVALVIQGSSLHITDAAAGQVTTLQLKSGSSRRLIIGPDGRTGYWVDASGALSCVDVQERHVTEAVQSRVVAISVNEGGTLWWLDANGDLFSSAACPTKPTPAVARGLSSVTAFLVAGSPATIFTLTTTGVVQTRLLPPPGGEIGPPLKETLLQNVDPEEGNLRSTDTPDPTTTNRLIKCGNLVHVIAGFNSPLNASAHVTFSLVGDPIGQRSVTTELVGIGCSPDGRAWGVPMLYSRAFALPRDGTFPANVIDERDQQTRVVVANSPNGSHTVVVHSDGRVDVLTVASAQWVAAANGAVVAVPIRDGVVTVDGTGEVQVQSNGASTVLGNLGAPPSPWTAALPDTAFVAAGDKVFAITMAGMKASSPLPSAVGVMTLSDQGTSLTVSAGDYIGRIGTDLAGPPQRLNPPALPNGEAITSAVTDSARQIVATNYGSVLVTDETGKIIARTSTGVAGITHARVLPDHSIVVAGGDGRLNKYTPDLQILSSNMFGPMAAGLQLSQDGSKLLVALTGNFSVWAVDAVTLQPIAKVATKTPDVRLVNISADGRTVVQLLPGAASSSDPARIVRTNL
ncbi:toll/interleukin-1 receptor domain-containing protein [Paenarthrobacter sp. NPDC089316]|uniref:toll/interleukin-1 receptor domain-containing protein n=1 Tax=unclassified Paenarthrobacter TaxID=2634190 RepID=UPI00342AD899